VRARAGAPPAAGATPAPPRRAEALTRLDPLTPV
jgi:hypothetical protein